jgi:hypothetical protein
LPCSGLLSPKDEDRRPVLRIIKPFPDYYEEFSVDLINVKDYEKNKCCDYCLDYLMDENMFFIVCPKDIAVAKPRTFDDHIDWLIGRQEYEVGEQNGRESKNRVLNNNLLLSESFQAKQGAFK